MIDMKLVGARADIEELVSNMAYGLYGVTLDVDTGDVTEIVLDTVKVSTLFSAPGAHIRISYHGHPVAGDHLARIGAALPADGAQVGAVLRDDAADLGAVWA